MRKLLAGLVVPGMIALLAPSNATAAGFLGASWGRTQLSADASDRSFSDTDIGWKVMGGFGPRYFGLEAFYVDLGRFQTSSGGVTLDADATGWDASIYGRVPIKKFEIFAKAGLIYWNADGQLSTTGTHDDSGTDISWGIGVGWTFGEHFGIRLEYESFEIDPDFANFSDLQMISLGVKYQF